MRGLLFRSGFHDYTIARGGLEIYPRLVAAEHRARHAPGMIQSGISELDELLGGGIDYGTSTLILGPAGSGKSTIGCQYISAAAERGECGVIYTFDENPSMLLNRCAALGADLAAHIRDGRVSGSGRAIAG